MALRPGCSIEPARLRLPLQCWSHRLLLAAALCLAAIPSGTLARPQQPVLPLAATENEAASSASHVTMDSANPTATKSSEWKGVVHSWPGYGLNDQLGRSVESGSKEAAWAPQRSSRVEKPANPPAAAGQAPTQNAPIGASLHAVATQLMTQPSPPTSTSPPTPSPTPPRQPAEDPSVRMEADEAGFQGFAEPVDVSHDQPSSPRPPSSALPSSLKPQPARPLPLTTIQPQVSTTASERISTWILLSGPHGTSTTPSATTFSSSNSGPSTPSSSSPQLKKAPSPAPPNPSASPTPKPGQQKLNQKRPGGAGGAQATRKPALNKRLPTTTATPPASSTTPATELVKISEAIVTSAPHKTKLPATTAEGKKPGKPNNATGTKRPPTSTTPPSSTSSITPVPFSEKTKVSTATIPFTPALAFRRRPTDSASKPGHKITTVVPPSSTTASSTTLAPTTIDELTTLPSTVSSADEAVTTTKRPKRPGSSHKKKKKNKKNRRRRPSKKTTTAVATTKPESKIGHDSNMSKPGQNGISTKIYNYLAREVMPSVSVGIIGLVVTAGLAGLFLYPFGGGVAARRHDEHLGPHGRLPPDRNYYYERDYPAMASDNSNSGGKAEEEIIGQVFSGMNQPETRYGYGPPIYGGGNSGPPDAQYPDSYKTQLSSSVSSEPDEERPGEGEIKIYADPSPLSSMPDSLQKTRYDIATPVDQVDITYPPSKKEESPYVVGSIAAEDASRYHYTGNANATVENEEKPKPAGSTYSVRVNGESGQVAVGYGAQSGSTGSVENADLGSSVELAYSGTGGGQPRQLKSHRRRRRRQVVASLVDSKQNELDGPIPEDKNVYLTSTPAVPTTELPTTVSGSDEVPMTTEPSSSEKQQPVTTSTPASSSTTLKTPSTTITFPIPTQPEDPLASIVGLLKRLAEYKLRLGANFLRGTSDVVTRYLGGVARRMEAAVAHLSEKRSSRRARRWEPVPVPGSAPKHERAPAPSRAKHILKKAMLTKKRQ